MTLYDVKDWDKPGWPSRSVREGPLFARRRTRAREKSGTFSTLECKHMSAKNQRRIGWAMIAILFGSIFGGGMYVAGGPEALLALVIAVAIAAWIVAASFLVSAQ